MKLKKCSSEIWNDVESGWVKGIHKSNSELKITVWLSTSIYQIFTTRCSRTFHRPRAFRITKTCEMNKSCSQTVLMQQEKWLNLSDKLSTINTSYLPCPSAFFIPWISPEVALVMRFFSFFLKLLFWKTALSVAPMFALELWRPPKCFGIIQDESSHGPHF